MPGKSGSRATKRKGPTTSVVSGAGSKTPRRVLNSNFDDINQEKDSRTAKQKEQEARVGSRTNTSPAITTTTAGAPQFFQMNGVAAKVVAARTVSPVEASLTALTTNVGGADASWYVSMESGEAEKGKLHELQKFIRKDFFPYWKFFTNKSQVMWCPGADSVSQYVCQKMNVKTEYKERWWHLNQDDLCKELNRKRSDTVGAMKRVFMGK
jgi:hypothetical protein